MNKKSFFYFCLICYLRYSSAIKCYVCQSCNWEDGTVKECDVSCEIKLIAEDGTLNKQCSQSFNASVTCHHKRNCTCSNDYCNGVEPGAKVSKGNILNAFTSPDRITLPIRLLSRDSSNRKIENSNLRITSSIWKRQRRGLLYTGDGRTKYVSYVPIITTQQTRNHLTNSATSLKNAGKTARRIIEEITTSHVTNPPSSPIQSSTSNKIKQEMNARSSLELNTKPHDMITYYTSRITRKISEAETTPIENLVELFDGSNIYKDTNILTDQFQVAQTSLNKEIETVGKTHTSVQIQSIPYFVSNSESVSTSHDDLTSSQSETSGQNWSGYVTGGSDESSLNSESSSGLDANENHFPTLPSSSSPSYSKHHVDVSSSLDDAILNSGETAVTLTNNDTFMTSDDYNVFINNNPSIESGPHTERNIFTNSPKTSEADINSTEIIQTQHHHGNKHSINHATPTTTGLHIETTTTSSTTTTTITTTTTTTTNSIPYSLRSTIKEVTFHSKRGFNDEPKHPKTGLNSHEKNEIDHVFTIWTVIGSLFVALILIGLIIIFVKLFRKKKSYAIN